MSVIDPRELRNAFGAFMTGVTVVTTCDGDGTPRGFTANSFTSVSLDPPMLLVCLAKTATSRPVFEQATGFAVNVLAESQKDVSNAFAARTGDRFASVDWHQGPAGHPVFDGTAAWFDCDAHQVVDGGDHIILLGHVAGFGNSERNGLGYARGGYFSIGLEQKAVTAARSEAQLVVGAIVEHDGRVLLTGAPDALSLPSCGHNGRPGSVSVLKNTLNTLGLDATLGPLYAVYENEKTGVHSIYYRASGGAGEPAAGRYYPVDAIPFTQIHDAPLTSMLKRYVDEHRVQRFGVYFGSDDAGEVRSFAD